MLMKMEFVKNRFCSF